MLEISNAFWDMITACIGCTVATVTSEAYALLAIRHYRYSHYIYLFGDVTYPPMKPLIRL